MIRETEKTPPVEMVRGQPQQQVNSVWPRTIGSGKTPPPGRPAGALSTAELVEKITELVSERASVELGRAHDELRARLERAHGELAAEVKMATRFGIAALITNAIVGIAVLGSARLLPGRIVGVGVACLAVFFVGVIGAGLRLSHSKRPRRITAATLK